MRSSDSSSVPARYTAALTDHSASRWARSLRCSSIERSVSWCSRAFSIAAAARVENSRAILSCSALKTPSLRRTRFSTPIRAPSRPVSGTHAMLPISGNAARIRARSGSSAAFADTQITPRWNARSAAGQKNVVPSRMERGFTPGVIAATRTLFGARLVSATMHRSTPSASGASSATRRSDSSSPPVW